VSPRAALQKQDLQVLEIQQVAKIAKYTDCAFTGSVFGPTNVRAAAMGAEKQKMFREITLISR
jgi:hypothetical protein